ncbi:hypothetical protein ACIOBK_33615 [Micromonospora chokoriensis]
MAVVVLAFLAVMPAASPANAEAARPSAVKELKAPSPQPSGGTDARADQVAAEVAASRCEKVRAEFKVPRAFGQICESRLAPALAKGADATASAIAGLCLWIPDLPLIGDVCDRVRAIMAGVAQEFQQRLETLQAGVEFARDPWGQTMTRVAELLGRSLSDLLTRVVTHLAHLSAPDVGSPAFLQSYAAGAGIAMFVLVALVARVIYRTSSGDMTGEELADSLWRRLPWAMVLVVFGPGIGYLLVELSNGATASILTYFATDVASLANKLNTMAIPANLGLIPGGPLVVIIIVMVAIVGALALLVGLLMQLLTLYFTGSIMAIAFVSLIDPEKRDSAMKLPLLWLALLAGRPAVFFLLGVTAKYGDYSFSVKALNDEGLRALVSALVAALMLLFVGVAPWAVLKFAPVLPAGGAQRIARSQRSSGGAFGGAAGSLMTHLAYRRMSSNSANSGGADAAPQAGPPPNLGPSSTGPDSGPGTGNAQRGQRGRSDERPGSGQNPSPAPPQGPGGQPGVGAGAGTAGSNAGAGAASAAGGGAGAGASAGTAGASAGAGAGAAGAGAGAAAAGATAATGGVAAVAVIGAQAAAGAKKKVDDAAHRAGDIVGDNE